MTLQLKPPTRTSNSNSPLHHLQHIVKNGFRFLLCDAIEFGIFENVAHLKCRIPTVRIWIYIKHRRKPPTLRRQKKTMIAQMVVFFIVRHPVDREQTSPQLRTFLTVSRSMRMRTTRLSSVSGARSSGKSFSCLTLPFSSNASIACCHSSRCESFSSPR